MNKQFNDKMSVLKKVFFVLVAVDFIGLIAVGIALFPTFKMLAGYGSLMLVVAIIIVAIMVAILLFEILAKLFLIRSTSPAFSWSSGYKGYVFVAILLLLFNLGAVIVDVLSMGGEGATPINQTRICLQMLASVAEMIAAFFYQRTVKRFFTEKKVDNH